MCITVFPAPVFAYSSVSTLTPLYFTAAVDTPIYNGASLYASKNGTLSKRSAVTIVERNDYYGQYFGKTDKGKYIYMDDLYFDFQRHMDENLNTMRQSYNTWLAIPTVIKPWESQFILSVAEGGIWDFKESLRRNRSYNCLIGNAIVRLTGEQIGNIHYGYVGSLMYSPTVLKVAAGLVQTNKDSSNCNLDSYCDDPKDQVNIQQGIDYYNGKSVSAVFGSSESPYQNNASHTEISGVTDASSHTEISGVTNVTSQFANKSVYLKSVETGAYVCGENGSTVHADGNCGSSNKGIFDTTLTSDGWLGFHLRDGKWLSVQNTGSLQTQSLKTTGDNLQSWECFKVYQKGNDYFLLAQKNLNFVQVSMSESAKPLRASRTYFDGLDGATWERFRIEEVGGNPGNSDQPTPTNMPSQPTYPQGTQWVDNKDFYKTDYINGRYTGYWDYSKPNGSQLNGQGKLVYATSSGMYKGGARYHEGNFVNGARDGWGTTCFTDCRYEGQWYGMYAKDKLIFDGKVIYTDGQYKGRTLIAKMIGTSTTEAVWSDDTHWETTVAVNPTPTPAPTSTPTPTPTQTPQVTSPSATSSATPSNSPTSTTATIILTVRNGGAGYENSNYLEWTEFNGRTLRTYRKDISTGEAELINTTNPDDQVWDGGMYDWPVHNGLYEYYVIDAVSGTESEHVSVYFEIVDDSAMPLEQNEITSGDNTTYSEPPSLSHSETSDYIQLWWDSVESEGYYLWRHDYSADIAEYLYGQKLNGGQPIYSGSYTDYSVIPGEIYNYQLQSVKTLMMRSYGGYGSTIDVEVPALSDGSPYDSVAADFPEIYVGDIIAEPALEKYYIDCYIGYPQMHMQGQWVLIDDNGTSPVVKNDRTLLPVRAIIESMGGDVAWDNTSDPNWDKVTCSISDYSVQMWVGYEKYFVNGIEYDFDVPPEIINDRTMIPARALFEAIGCEVSWEKDGGGDGWDMVTIAYWK
jgi:hypothetical protein